MRSNSQAGNFLPKTSGKFIENLKKVGAMKDGERLPLACLDANVFLAV
jgi:hypothetical protein